MSLKLYTYFRSSAAFRVRIALNLKGLAYEPALVHLAKGEHRKPEYAAVNPQGLVPALDVDGHLLTQSIAILEYLEETHPQPPLLPREAFGRARVRSLSLLIACEIHPLNNLRTLRHLKQALGQTDEQVNAWYRHWIADGLAKLEAALRVPATGRFCHGDAPGMADCCLVPQIFNAKRYQCDLAPYPTVMRVPATGRFCHGDAPGMADCCLVPQIFNAKRYQCDLAPYPTVMRVFDACMQLDAFARAQPDKQPDAE